MPLEKGSSQATISRNIAELVKAGHSQKQAEAIAYAESGKDSSSARVEDINGWYEVEANPLSKVGVFEYSGRAIDPAGQYGLIPDVLYKVYRPAEELSDPECIESFKLVPWTNDHPKRLLGDPEIGGVAPEDKGIEGVTGERIFFDELDQMLKGNIKVFSQTHANRISGGKVELSLGYRCRYVKEPGIYDGDAYEFVQRTIRGNHVASVKSGRMGSDVAVLDALTFTVDAKEFIIMSAKKQAVIDAKKKILAYTADSKEPLTALMAAYDAAKDEEKKEDEEEAKAKAAKDAEEEEKKKADEKAAKDAEEAEAKKKEEEAKGKDGKGMDAAEVARIVQTEVAKALKTVAPAMDAKEMMAEISKRDALATRLSHFVGSFDASEMTHAEVAAYGLEKLKLTAAKGQELATLTGFLHDRPAPGSRQAFAQDSSQNSGATNFVQKQIHAVK